jgi:hypothetical protein
MSNRYSVWEDCDKSEQDEMSIESVSLLKSYSHDKQELTVAVSVSDIEGKPVNGGYVDLVVIGPKGASQSMKGLTDENGLALFEVDKVDKGRWEVVVFGVEHPCYRLSLSENSLRWRITNI